MSSPTTTQPLGGPGGAGGHRDQAQAITDFVAAVRDQLDDLSADEVTELTGGLEADLTDALREEQGAAPLELTPAQVYGDPAAYAAELRSAAGLPPRVAGGGRRDRQGDFVAGLVNQVRADVRLAKSRLETLPWFPPAWDFLVALRPVWWVLRAWLAVQVILGEWGDSGVVSRGLLGLLVLIAAVIVSVELGRRRSALRPWLLGLVVVGNLIAALVFLPVVANLNQTAAGGYASQAPDSPSSGLVNAGNPVLNIFPYDAQGRPLTGVQLYDQDGHVLGIGPDEQDAQLDPDPSGQVMQLAPGSGAGSLTRWNVFPLQQRPVQDDGDLGQVQPAVPPFPAVPPLVGPTATPGTSASATSSLTPTATATPVATK